MTVHWLGVKRGTIPKVGSVTYGTSDPLTSIAVKVDVTGDPGLYSHDEVATYLEALANWVRTDAAAASPTMTGMGR